MKIWSFEKHTDLSDEEKKKDSIRLGMQMDPGAKMVTGRPPVLV